jgi:hypothetical protein
LQDRALKAFRPLHDVSDTYDSIKEKLCDWFDDLRDVRKEENKALFKKARPESTESMYLYSTRLERLDLAEFDFTIKYRPGKDNTAADTMSRVINAPVDSEDDPPRRHTSQKTKFD